jgi:hypothetical protein
MRGMYGIREMVIAPLWGCEIQSSFFQRAIPYAGDFAPLGLGIPFVFS